MADQITPNLGFTKPEVGGSEDTWGEKLNGNFDIIDAKAVTRTGSQVNQTGLRLNSPELTNASGNLVSATTGVTQTVGDASNKLATTQFVMSSVVAAATNVPGQTGNGGKYLSTDGTNSSWQSVGQFRGTYNALSRYYINESVLFAGDEYVALTENLGVTPLDGANWRLTVSAANPDGVADGTPLIALGGKPVFGNTKTYEEITVSGTWEKPEGITYIYVESWGAGASGSKGSGARAGGGGGEYVSYLFQASEIDDSVAVTIGAGGAAGSGFGSNGGSTSFGSYITAFGGKAPTTSLFTTALPRGSGVLDGTGLAVNNFIGYTAGRGAAPDAGDPTRQSGISIYGGAGGAGKGPSGEIGVAGTSDFAGDGGAASLSGTAGNGGFPAGGGGSTSTGTAGDGGNGLIKIWTW